MGDLMAEYQSNEAVINICILVYTIHMYVCRCVSMLVNEYMCVCGCAFAFAN